MHTKSYFWSAVTWFVAGSVVGTYLPGTPPSQRVHDGLNHVLSIYPALTHLTLIAFLFLLTFAPAAHAIRRYRHNWQAKTRLFTILDGTALFILGWTASALLNGSLPLSVSAYSPAARSALWVWLPACATFLVSTFLFSFVEPTPLLLHPTPEDLIDVPITDEEQDTLGRRTFVDNFHALIQSFPFEDSLVFGLNAPWGSGKTSVLNLLRNRLRKDENTILVDFNPWYFQSAETITRRFYDSVASSINREFFYPHLRAIARRYARILSPVLKKYGVELPQTDEPTVEEAKAMVESYIVDTGRRVLVIVDDLERANDSELATILQIVRLSANFKNTMFVLAYDQTQLCGQLSKVGMSPDFLSKIVQIPMDLPGADKNEIDRFVIYSDAQGHKSQLDRLLDKLEITGDRRNVFDKESVELYRTRLSPFFPTLRNAKRFLIGLSVRLPAVKNEVSLLDFFLLEILRVFANAVYQDIWANPFFYLPSWTTKSMLSSPFPLDFDDNRKQWRRVQIKNHIDDLLKNEPQKDNILEILKKLFAPRIADAYGRPASYGDNAAAAFRAEKKLTHPECFDKYFLLAVPKDAVPDAAVEAKLASWAKSENPENAILEDIANLRESNQLVETLNRILTFLRKLDDKVIMPLLKAISRGIESVPIEGDRSEQDARLRLILFLLNDRVSAEEKQATTEAVIRDIHAIDVAVRVVNALASDESAVTWELRRSLDLSLIQKIVQERFAKEFVDTDVNIFGANSLAQYVLYQVGTYNAESAQMVNGYAMALLEREPKYIGKFIDGFLVEFPGGPHSFNFDQLKLVYDANHLAELARRAGGSAWTNEKEKRAIETFLRLVEGENPGDPPQQSSEK
jgi:predicted KAP-like P-loop ATPase